MDYGDNMGVSGDNTHVITAIYMYIYKSLNTAIYMYIYKEFKQWSPTITL